MTFVRPLFSAFNSIKESDYSQKIKVMTCALILLALNASFPNPITHYSTIPTFHYSIVQLTANTTPLGEIKTGHLYPDIYFPGFVRAWGNGKVNYEDQYQEKNHHHLFALFSDRGGGVAFELQ